MIATMLLCALLADGIPPTTRKHRAPARAPAVPPAPETAAPPSGEASRLYVPAPVPVPQPQPAPAPAAAPAAAPAPEPAAACVPVAEPARLPVDPRPGASSVCLPASYPDRSCLVRHPLCERDREIARIAWQYFRHNTQPTGLVNATDGYPSSTAWEVGSAIAANLAARELDLVTAKESDDRLAALLAALATQKLYRDELPNKAYSTLTNEMTDYTNKPSPAGIGYSALDVSRLLSWLDLAACMVPKQRQAAEHVAARYNFCRMVGDGQLYGATRDSGEDVKVQEGRLGYEQYAGRLLHDLGFKVPLATSYRNEEATVDVEGVPIVYDRRSPREYGAINYVVTESYALDVIESGATDESAALLRNILEAQRRRWQRTGLVTAVTEDHVDRPPWFVYNTIYAAGQTWLATTDTLQNVDALKTLSVKAAMSLATLYPDDPYSSVLTDAVRSAYDPDRGWYAGIYESGMGYNRALTANTNGVLLELMLYKLYGPLRAACHACHRGLLFPPRWMDPKDAARHCLPSRKAP